MQTLAPTLFNLLLVQHRIHFRGAIGRSTPLAAAQAERTFSRIVPSAVEARTMSCRQRRRLIEKEQLRPQPRLPMTSRRRPRKLGNHR